MNIDTRILKTTLNADRNVIFAYLYGSCLESEQCADIDIAVYSTPEYDPFLLSADLKIKLAENHGMSPDIYDIRVINHLIAKGDLFSLIYLREVLTKGVLLEDKDFQSRSTYIEAFNMKYRECEGLIAEVCA